MSEHLTIGQAAKATGLTVDSIRFYERDGVLLRARRSAGGRRLFSPHEILELTFIARLRAVRTPLPEIARYLALARKGEHTLPERIKIIAAQRDRVIEQIAGLQETLRILDFKLAAGAPLIAGRAGDALSDRETALKRRALRLVSGAK